MIERIAEGIRTHLKAEAEHKVAATWHAVEVGKGLIEAKELVERGKWQEWLRVNFQLSQSAACRYMKIARRFGVLETTQKLNTSQMVEMLALPAGEEEGFLAAVPVEGLTVKEVRAEVRRYTGQEARPRKTLKAENEALTAEVKRLKEELEQPRVVAIEQVPDDYEAMKAEIARLTAENEALKAENAALTAENETMKAALAADKMTLRAENVELKAKLEDAQIEINGREALIEILNDDVDESITIQRRLTAEKKAARYEVKILREENEVLTTENTALKAENARLKSMVIPALPFPVNEVVPVAVSAG